MKILLIISVALLMTVISCQTRNVSSIEELQIPEFLMRPNLIGPDEEMGYMLDTYNKLINKIKLNPKDIEARLALAELFMQEARISGEHGHYYPAALKIVESVIQQSPEAGLKYRTLLDKASILLSLHQFEQAKETGEEALALNPYSADAYGVLVDAFVEMGAYDKAVAMADKMVSIRPDIRSY